MVLILSIGNLIPILLKPRESGKLVGSKDFEKYREAKKQEQAEDEKKRKLAVFISEILFCKGMPVWGNFKGDEDSTNTKDSIELY